MPALVVNPARCTNSTSLVLLNQFKQVRDMLCIDARASIRVSETAHGDRCMQSIAVCANKKTTERSAFE